MKKTVITDDLIVFSDGFVWKRLSRKVAEALWNSVISHELELYWVRTDDESEAAIERFKDMERAFECGDYVCIEVGKLPYNMAFGYIHNLQEISSQAITRLTDTKDWSRDVAYSAENIEKRREEAHKAKVLKKRAEICERYDKIIRQAEAEKKIMLCVFDYGLSTDNVIYYNHTNTLSFNWRDYGEKITQEEFDDFVNNVDRSQLPEGIKFELK